MRSTRVVWHRPRPLPRAEAVASTREDLHAVPARLPLCLASKETQVSVHRLQSKTDRLEEWRVAKKIKPSQSGAIKLSRAHGPNLLCVRYRESPDGTERLTTVELVVERTVIQKRRDPVVSFKIRHDELELRAQAIARGAKYDSKNYMWKLKRSEVLRMGLKSRIAVTLDELLQEQIRP